MLKTLISRELFTLDIPKLPRKTRESAIPIALEIHLQSDSHELKSAFHRVYRTLIFFIVILMRPERGKKAKEENIFNMVAPDPKEIVKEKLHRSKFPGNLPPTGSTFGLHSTSAKVD